MIIIDKSLRETVKALERDTTRIVRKSDWLEAKRRLKAAMKRIDERIKESK